jgi:hypothetical protein
MVGPALVILLDNPFSIQLTLFGLEDYGIKLALTSPLIKPKPVVVVRILR